MPNNAIVTMVIYIVLIALMMYFMVFLPQKRREKKVKTMLDAIKVGDEICTIGGIIGKVVNIKDDEVVVETAVERTRIKLKKWSIRDVEKSAEEKEKE